MSWDDVKGVVYALAPTIGLSVVFYVVIRSIIRADADERRAAEEFLGAPPPDGENGSGDGVGVDTPVDTPDDESGDDGGTAESRGKHPGSAG